MNNSPLAERLRPRTFEEYVGQSHLVGSNGSLQKLIKRGAPVSIVFYGPPGCGKTTLAKLYLKSFSLPVETIHATTSATSDFKRIIDASNQAPLFCRPMLVWIDEVHRLTRPQQDLLLDSLEKGTLVLVAATTENPSFQLSPAILSRVQVMILKPLEHDNLHKLYTRIETTYGKIPLTIEAKNQLIEWAGGDARSFLNWIEQLQREKPGDDLTCDELASILQKKRVAIDPTGEGRYQLISALHKAVRGSDCQASLYWFARQLTAGEDARYIGRRLIRMASEDIGLADPQALQIALNGLAAYEKLGSPEGELALAQVVLYLALAPKSNSAYTAYNTAKAHAEQTHQYMPPAHIVNAATPWMKQAGFGEGYLYDHDQENGFSGQNYFPDSVSPQEYFTPIERGFERELAKRLAYFSKLKSQ
ncbi:MAG: replication-associated recombination protein A [Chlamydiales bacterium]|nr:replication-associated recombination protein A [Chlamydiales bacterium]